MDSTKFLEFAAIISRCLEIFYNRENTARIGKKQRRFRWRRKEKNVYFKSFFLLPLRYVAKGNRIDLERGSASAVREISARKGWSTCGSALRDAFRRERDLKEKKGKNKNTRVTFSFHAETKAFPLRWTAWGSPVISETTVFVNAMWEVFFFLSKWERIKTIEKICHQSDVSRAWFIHLNR